MFCEIPYHALPPRTQTNPDPSDKSKTIETPWNLVICNYHSYFSEQTKDVDRKAEMSRYFGGLLRFGKLYEGDFAAKCVKYSKSVILLC
jgi:hypothetical protein